MDEQIERCRRRALAMLKNYNANKVQLEMLTSKLRELERRTDVGVGAVSYDQPTSGTTNKVSSVVETAIIAKEREIERLQNELARVQGRLERIDIALANLPMVQRELLRLKYIEGLQWREVAEIVGYDIYYTKKQLKSRAVSRLAGFLFPELMAINLFEREDEEKCFMLY